MFSKNVLWFTSFVRLIARLFIVCSFVLGFFLSQSVEIRAATEKHSKLKTSKNKEKKKKKEIGREFAEKELSLSQEALSNKTNVKAATVNLEMASLNSPLSYTQVQFGLFLKTYSPIGRNSQPGQSLVDYENLGLLFLPSLELRWLPLQFEYKGLNVFGGYLSASYNVINLDIYSQTGKSFPDSTLNTLVLLSGVAIERPITINQQKDWGLLFKSGMGKLYSIQSSSSAFANHSSQLNFLNFDIALQKHFKEKWAYAFGYEYRLPLREMEDLRLFRNGLNAGFLGTF